MELAGAGVGRSAVLSLAGEVDTASVARLNRVADALLVQPDIAQLAVDFSANTFIDSIGLGLLVRLRLECIERDIALQLVEVPHRVQVMLRITGLTDAFTIKVVPL